LQNVIRPDIGEASTIRIRLLDSGLVSGSVMVRITRQKISGTIVRRSCGSGVLVTWICITALALPWN